MDPNNQQAVGFAAEWQGHNEPSTWMVIRVSLVYQAESNAFILLVDKTVAYVCLWTSVAYALYFDAGP